MATYAELFDLQNDSALRNRIAVAATVKAQDFLDSATPTAGQVAWSSATLDHPQASAKVLTRYVLATMKGKTPAEIAALTDNNIQAKVNKAADVLAGV